MPRASSWHRNTNWSHFRRFVFTHRGIRNFRLIYKIVLNTNRSLYKKTEPNPCANKQNGNDNKFDYSFSFWRIDKCVHRFVAIPYLLWTNGAVMRALRATYYTILSRCIYPIEAIPSNLKNQIKFMTIPHVTTQLHTFFKSDFLVPERNKNHHKLSTIIIIITININALVLAQAMPSSSI